MSASRRTPAFRAGRQLLERALRTGDPETIRAAEELAANLIEAEQRRDVMVKLKGRGRVRIIPLTDRGREMWAPPT